MLTSKRESIKKTVLSLTQVSKSVNSVLGLTGLVKLNAVYFLLAECRTKPIEESLDFCTIVVTWRPSNPGHVEVFPSFNFTPFPYPTQLSFWKTIQFKTSYFQRLLTDDNKNCVESCANFSHKHGSDLSLNFRPFACRQFSVSNSSRTIVERVCLPEVIPFKDISEAIVGIDGGVQRCLRANV